MAASREGPHEQGPLSQPSQELFGTGAGWSLSKNDVAVLEIEKSHSFPQQKG